MPVAFGFSIGDFIAVIEVVSIIYDALKDSGEAGTEYREILAQLHSLKTALGEVQRVEIDNSLDAELFALHHAASQCQQSIDEFWTKIQDYQPSLGYKDPRSSKLKEKWMRIK